MTFKIHHNRFLLTALGGLGIISGVVLKNSVEQLKLNGHPFSKLGAILFFIGWLIVAYSIIMTNRGGFSPNLKTLIVILSVSGILYAVSNLKRLMKLDAPKEVKKPYMLLFIMSWLLLGIACGLGRNNTAFILGISAALCVILSMIFILPMQRKACVVDGPGMPMFTVGFMLLAFGNSVY